MQEYTTDGEIEIADDANLTDLVWANEREHPDHVVFSKRAGGDFTDVTSARFATEVRRLAAGLADAGVQVGDRVALMSKTRYEWVVCDFAIWVAGAVTVPIYETSSAEQVEWILRDSGAVGGFVETAAHASLVESVRGSADAFTSIWTFEAGDLETLSRDADPADAALNARHRAAGKDDLATIIYTSGTTGRPKGCELTHGNLLYETYATGISFGDFLNERGTLLLFVPLAHVLGRATQLTCFHARTRVGHSPDIKNLVPELAVFQPTFLLAVPRVFEKVYNSSKQKAHAEGKGAIYDMAEQVAIAYSEALDQGGPGLVLKLKHGVFDKLVYSKLRHALGGNVAHCVSGGAPLGARLGHFFRGIGVTILEGYGLTETSAGITSNSTPELKIGTVGRPMVGDSVRIAGDGEILLRGGQIFRGYFNNAAATKEAFTDDGWFRTGDVGELDGEGYLKITGRKKEILVTAGGKNVAPAVLEDRLRAHALVSQCIVVGDGKPFVGALVTIDPDALRAWRKQHSKDETTPVADLVDDADLRAEIQSAVTEANKAVSAAESIKVFRILPVDFTEEGGQMTPSLKLKRSVVMQEFAPDVRAIYGD
ncbi:MAG: long-chain fatty acid--CoA ligase [Mycobacteriales bacterium]